MLHYNLKNFKVYLIRFAEFLLFNSMFSRRKDLCLVQLWFSTIASEACLLPVSVWNLFSRASFTQLFCLCLFYTDFSISCVDVWYHHWPLVGPQLERQKMPITSMSLKSLGTPWKLEDSWHITLHTSHRLKWILPLSLMLSHCHLESLFSSDISEFNRAWRRAIHLCWST